MPRSRFPGASARLVQTFHWHRIAAGLGVVAAAALAIGIVISAGLPGSSKGAGKPAKASGSPRSSVVISSRPTRSPGTLGYADPQTVYNRVTGTVTWLPTIGQVIKPGGTLYKVDNAPVVLFDGAVPAYRDLASGITDGPDVQELNENLGQAGILTRTTRSPSTTPGNPARRTRLSAGRHPSVRRRPGPLRSARSCSSPASSGSPPSTPCSAPTAARRRADRRGIRIGREHSGGPALRVRHPHHVDVDRRTRVGATTEQAPRGSTGRRSIGRRATVAQVDAAETACKQAAAAAHSPSSKCPGVPSGAQARGSRSCSRC